MNMKPPSLQANAHAAGIVPHAGPPLTVSVGSEVRWRLGQQVGRGANGTVFEGLNEATGEKFAVKSLSVSETSPASPSIAAGGGGDRDAGTGDDTLAELRREVAALRPLKHPHIVRYLGTELVNEQLLVFMEYCAEGSLLSLMSSFGGNLAEPVVAYYGKQVISGLSYLHSHGVTHSDLKPANVMIAAGRVAKIADFGTAVARG